DSDDLVAQLVRVLTQVRDDVDVLHVLGDGHRQDRVVVPHARVLELVAVVLPVVTVSLRKPGVHEDVEVTVGGTLVHRGHVQVGDGDVVALLLQAHLPHVGGGDALLPRDQRELDLLVVLTSLRDVAQRLLGVLPRRRLGTGGAFVTVTPTVPVGVVRQAAPLPTGRQQERAAQAQSRERRKTLVHVCPFLRKYWVLSLITERVRHAPAGYCACSPLSSGL